MTDRELNELGMVENLFNSDAREFMKKFTAEGNPR